MSIFSESSPRRLQGKLEKFFIFVDFSVKEMTFTLPLGHFLLDSYKQTLILAIHVFRVSTAISSHSAIHVLWKNIECWQITPYSCCPIARHRTVSHMATSCDICGCITNMSALLPCLAQWKKFILWFSGVQMYGATLRDTVHLYHVTSYFLLYPLIYGITLSDSMIFDVSFGKEPTVDLI